MKITREDFKNYVAGWLFVVGDFPNDLDLDNMSAALHNACHMLRDDQDGIEEYIKRQKRYENQRNNQAPQIPN